MGEVWKGLDRETGRPVAIKALKPEILDRPRVLARFTGEAQALDKLDHPNIVKLVATEQGADGRHYLIMEYVSGGSLRQVLDQRSRLTARESVRIGLQLCDALARVHFLGIVHRDVKPANVLLAGDGTPRLTDFGIAHLTGNSRITERGDVIGTLPYLSPEACNGDPLDVRTDIWALGVMLYEMLTGQRPFNGETPASLVAAITSRPAAPLRTRCPRVPCAVESLVESMLIKDRRGRLPSARNAGAALEQILEQLEAAPDVDATPESHNHPKALHRALSPGEVRRSAANEVVVVSAPQPVLDPASAGFDPAAPTESMQGEPVPPPPERKPLLILLDKVKRFWVTGLLEHTLPERDFIQLHHRPCPTLVKRPWDQLVSEPDTRPGGGDQPTPRADTALDAFDDSDRALLILGQPGCGKTTALLRLARALIARAERDHEQPIPVVLNLSSWAETRGPLVDWIALELTAKYQIPRQMGREWLADHRLLLLLDELDGAQRHDRQACILAINEFRVEHGLTGLVVCSRRADYEASSARLELGGAFEIEPIDPERLAAYLAIDAHANVRAAVERDAALRELARSPLMLNIIKRVYAPEGDRDDGRIPAPLRAADGIGDDHGEPADALHKRREQLFAAYVARMNRRAAKRQAGASAERMQARLSWLARQMLAHNQASFLVEQIQPSWLPSRGWRWLYLVLTRVLFTGVLGAAWGWTTASAGYNSDLYTVVQAHLSLSMLQASVLAYAGLAALSGLIAAAVEGLLFEHRRGHADEARLVGNRGHRDDVLLAFAVALTVFAVHSAFDTVNDLAIHDTFMAAIAIAILLAHHESSQSWQTDLRVVESLSWSWRRAVRWTGTFGLGLSLLWGPVLAWYISVFVAIDFCVSITVLFFVLGGLRGRRPEAWDAPNQGIRLSVRNALKAGLILGTPIAVQHELVNSGSGLAAFTLGGLFGGLSYGLADVIKHYCLRAFLWVSGRAPLGLIGALEDAASRALLRRVGGGYIFMHRRLIDYFAALPEKLDTAR